MSMENRDNQSTRKGLIYLHSKAILTLMYDQWRALQQFEEPETTEMAHWKVTRAVWQWT